MTHKGWVLGLWLTEALYFMEFIMKLLDSFNEGGDRVKVISNLLHILIYVLIILFHITLQMEGSLATNASSLVSIWLSLIISLAY